MSHQKARIAICLCLFLDKKRPLFNQQCNAWDIESSELIVYHMTTTLSVSSSKFSQSSLQLQQTSVTLWPLPMWNFPVSCSPSLLIFSVLMPESKFTWIICGFQCYIRWHQFIQISVFSSVVGSVCNSSFRAAIFIQCLCCLNKFNIEIHNTHITTKTWVTNGNSRLACM